MGSPQCRGEGEGAQSLLLRNYIVNGVRHTAYTAAHTSTNTDSGFGKGEKSTHISARNFFPPADLTQPDLFGCEVGELFGRPTTRKGYSTIHFFE